MSTNYRVVSSDGRIFGIGTYEMCVKIVDSFKQAKTGHGKPAACSSMTFNIETYPGDYPAKEAIGAFTLNYSPTPPDLAYRILHGLAK
jgi:hypothetical protein